MAGLRRITALMKKHSKTGVESRFQGTVLGHSGDPKPIRIEGGPVDSIEAWCRRTREQAAVRAAKEKPQQSNHVSRATTEVSDVAVDSVDTVEAMDTQ